METLESLIENAQHEKILQLPSPEYNKFKTIAAIHLEKYEEALQYAEKATFELAYIHYKLKNFKKALKILRKLSGKDVDVLKAQCLYFLGYYSAAYELLSKHGHTDEFAVNLTAMEALAHLNSASPSKPSLFTSRDTGSVRNPVPLKFKSVECQMECEYNSSFKYAENEREWVRVLMELRDKYREEGSCIEKQLKNLMDEDVPSPTKREAEICQFNKGIKTTIQNPVLFQGNFMTENTSSDYQIFKKYELNKEDFVAGKASFQPFNDKLRLLKSLIISKRKPSPKNAARIAKTLEKVRSDSLDKRILTFLSLDLPEEEFQKGALELMLEVGEAREMEE